MDSKKIYVSNDHKYGKGVFAKEDIKKDEVVAVFDGKYYEAENAMLLPNEPPLRAGRHTVQYEKYKWRDGPVSGAARYINHSCGPNCGIKNFFKVVAMRNIKKGEEIAWDYAMTEDSNFRMKCSCGTKSCRGTIGAYSMLPQSVRDKYKGYISEWLTKK